MMRQMIKSKIHRATVTQADLNYVGSITIDEVLMEKVNLLPYEKVHVLNVNNGARLETYVITGAKDSGVICLNGAAARLVQVGDIVLIISFGFFNEEELTKDYKPKVILVDESNKFVKYLV